MNTSLQKTILFILNTAFWTLIPFVEFFLRFGRWGTGEGMQDASAVIGFGLTGIITSLLLIKNWTVVARKKSFFAIYVVTALIISFISVIAPIILEAIPGEVSSSLFYSVLAPLVMAAVNVGVIFAMIKSYANSTV